MGIVYGMCLINVCLNNKWITIWLHKARMSDSANYAGNRKMCMVLFLLLYQNMKNPKTVSMAHL